MLLDKSLASVFTLLLYVLRIKVSLAEGPFIFDDDDVPIVPFPNDSAGTVKDDIVGIRQSFFPTFMQKTYALNSVCKDGNFATGRCLVLKDCPNLLRIARDPKSAQYTFLQFSICGTFRNSQHFCCKGTEKISDKSPPATFSKTNFCETSSDINFSECGETKLLGDRVVGGKVAEKNSIPWIALILKDSFPSCGGTLITNKHVLSAAHCFVDSSGILTEADITIRLAEHDTTTTSDGRHFDMATDIIRVHEDYNLLTQVNDIAMVKLKRPVCFSRRVRPICVPDLSWKSRNLEPYQPYVAGWGYTEAQDVTSNVLLQAELSVFSTDECQASYAKVVPKEFWKAIDDRTLCAGDILGIKDSCGGDSGGPLILGDSRSQGKNGEAKQFLIGVVSRGPKKCGSKGLPGIYIRVSSYFEWIKEHAV